MRQLTIFASLLVALCLAACGHTDKSAQTAAQSASDTSSAGDSPARTASGAAAGRAPFKGDEDDDDNESKTYGKVATGDSDADRDNESQDNRGKGYYDPDDNPIRDWGGRASAADAQAIAAVVRRYEAAAAAANGALACSLIYSVLAEAIPEDYGHSPAPTYMRGDTCPAVMSALFEHSHSELADTSEVTGVRVKAKRAFALLGSAVKPAGYMVLQREGHVWKIDVLVSNPLP